MTQDLSDDRVFGRRIALGQIREALAVELTVATGLQGRVT